MWSGSSTGTPRGFCGATGPRRRLFWGNWQLIVYERENDWHVRHCNETVISGRAETLLTGKLSAAWAAMLLALMPGWREGRSTRPGDKDEHHYFG